MANQVPHSLLRGARLRPGTAPVDIRVRDGRITEIAPRLDRAGAQIHDAGGALAIPGLWDGHVHFGQWSAMTRRVDVADTVGAGDTYSAGILHALASRDLLGAARREALAAMDPDDLRQVLEEAAALAAITVSRPGADPPWNDELGSTSRPS